MKYFNTHKEQLLMQETALQQRIRTLQETPEEESLEAPPWQIYYTYTAQSYSNGGKTVRIVVVFSTLPHFVLTLPS